MKTATVTPTARKKSSPRRMRKPVLQRPFHFNGWDYDGDGKDKARDAAKPPTILFPDPAAGWSVLCAEIVERACAYVLELDGLYDVCQWGGPVPGLQRDDLLGAAQAILNADRLDKIPFADVLAALDEAWRFVGFEL